MAQYSDAFSHAAEALELGGVLDMIASRCSNPSAKLEIQEREPTTDHATLDRRFDEAREICAYQTESGRLAIIDTSVGKWIGGARDNRETISPEGLLVIAAAESSVFEVQRLFKTHDELYPRLFALIGAMIGHKDLIKSIGRSIDGDGSIRDKASSALADIRRRIGRSKGDIRKHTDQLAKKHGSLEYATFTGNRYLLLVPREKCKQKEGIVHATSHTGESLYFEPLSLVERNNNLETLLQDERAEEARIITELNSQVLVVGDELLANMAQWERLDVLNAIGDFARDYRCAIPRRSEDGTIRLENARHPLLESSLRANGHDDGAVPLDVELAPGKRVMVITGPNAGGKTVMLKSVGLLTLMYQCGLPVPCDEGSELAIFDRVFADIGDEQSISSSLSTFTSHLQHLDAMCRGADEHTLCLVDEIGDGTDPDEGAALAIATLERLLESNAAVIATTHYGKVKTFALNADGVENASMIFDDDNDRPLYRLLQGTAGRSRGLETARRLDFFEPVVERAQSMIGQDTFRLEAVLSELEAARLALERERATVDSQTTELDRLIESYERKEREIREHKAEHKSRARKEAEDILVQARREIEAIVKKIRETSAAKDTVREAHVRIKALADTAGESVPVSTNEKTPVEEVSVGDRVSLNPNGEPSGEVVEVRRNEVTVEINGKKINAKRKNLYRPRSGEAKPQDVSVDVSVEPLRGTSLDVRGHDREEALAAVDFFLDRAVLNGVQEVVVIHGVGEEILLVAIQAHLKNDSRVQSVRTGGLGEGGRGVSVIQLK